MALDVGQVLEGKYRIERVLGRGGMGTVYEGVHTRIHRRVAIKVLKASLAADDDMVKRFEREALAASSVRSNHVVEVYDVGQLADGERYMILEFLDGESLSARLKRLGTMAPNQIFPLVIEALEGLQAAHDAGIVHRDLKPANIFIAKVEGAGELVKVLDFGVSKFSALGGEAMTQTGAVVGTPHYMAPEQTKGARHAGPLSDIYAMGAILFRSLTGRPPFVAETIHELIAKLITTTAPSVTTVAPTVDPSAAALVDRALEKEPQARYASAREMMDALTAWQSQPGAAIAGAIAAPAADDDAPTIATPSSSLRSFATGPSTGTGSITGPITGPTTGAESITGPITGPTMGTPPPAVSTTSVWRDPSDQLTPSPATLDSQASAPRSRLGIWVGASLFLLVGVAVGAVTLTGGDATSDPAAEGDAAASPPETESESATQTGIETEIEPASSASEPVSSATASATTTASAGPPPPAPPIPKPRPRPVAKPRPAPPPPPPPPASDGRDIREDI